MHRPSAIARPGQWREYDGNYSSHAAVCGLRPDRLLDLSSVSCMNSRGSARGLSSGAALSNDVDPSADKTPQSRMDPNTFHAVARTEGVCSGLHGPFLHANHSHNPNSHSPRPTHREGANDALGRFSLRLAQTQPRAHIFTVAGAPRSLLPLHRSKLLSDYSIGDQTRSHLPRNRQKHPLLTSLSLFSKSNADIVYHSRRGIMANKLRSIPMEYQAPAPAAGAGGRGCYNCKLHSIPITARHPRHSNPAIHRCPSRL